MNKNKFKVLGLAVSVLLILLDQLTKAMASSGLKGQDDIILIPGVLQFHYLENRSAAFSMDPVSLIHRIFHISYFDANPAAFLKTKMIFFGVLTVVVCAIVLWLFWRMPVTRKMMPLNILTVFFLAGAIGNLIDRVCNAYVVDFIYFSLIDFPVFNVADIYVTCSCFILIPLFLFYYKEEDLKWT